MRDLTIRYHTQVKNQNINRIHLFLDGKDLGGFLPDQVGTIELDDHEHEFFFATDVEIVFFGIGGSRNTVRIYSNKVNIPENNVSQGLMQIRYVFDAYFEQASFRDQQKANLKQTAIQFVDKRQAAIQYARDLYKIRVEQQSANQKDVAKKTSINAIDDQARRAISDIAEQFTKNQFAKLDFRKYDRLSDEAKEIFTMKKKHIPYLLAFVYRVLCKRYFEGTISVRMMLLILNQLRHIDECKEIIDSSLTQFDYLVKESNDINSVFSENVIEDIDELVRNAVLQDYDPKEYDNMKERLFGNGLDEKTFVDYETPKSVFDFIVKAREETSYFVTLKKTMIEMAILESDYPEFADTYMIIVDGNNKVFTPWIIEGEKVVYSKTVDMLIADAYHYSKVNLMNQIDKDLETFLNVTCPALNISGSQYVILQKVFAHLQAYKQEEMVLEAMIKNSIPRTAEQNERLAFLRTNTTGSLNFGGIPVNTVVASKQEQESGKLLYEYKFLKMNDNDLVNYFNSLSMANQTSKTPIVVYEWVQNVEAPNICWDAGTVQERLNTILEKNFGKKYSGVVIESGVASTGWQEYTPSVQINDVSTDGYPWLSYVVVGDQLMVGQLTLSIYALYVPEKDKLPENVYDKNSLILGKVQMLKNSQHPKMNNLIKMMTNLIIKELETWINSKREDSIYD